MLPSLVVKNAVKSKPLAIPSVGMHAGASRVTSSKKVHLLRTIKGNDAFHLKESGRFLPYPTALLPTLLPGQGTRSSAEQEN
jgi:hypothetical protein